MRSQPISPSYPKKKSRNKQAAARAREAAIRARVARFAKRFMPLVDWCLSRGLGQGTGWELAKQGRLPVVHIPGINRTMVDCEEADKLFVPGRAQDALPVPYRRPGRPKKTVAAKAAREATPPPKQQLPTKRGRSQPRKPPQPAQAQATEVSA
jgi:hypothetical protein